MRLGGDYWTRTSGLMRVNIRWGRGEGSFCSIRAFRARILLFQVPVRSVVSARIFPVVGQDVGQAPSLHFSKVAY